MNEDMNKYNNRIDNIIKMLSEIEIRLKEILKATINSPPWSSISHTKENHPNKSDFIIQRGENWSDWKLPYKYKGKIHCGGVRAASAAAGGAHTGNRMNLTSEEKARLNSARKACGIGGD